MHMYELSPRYDSRKSFYHKATVQVNDDGSKVLVSYITPVATISPDGVIVVNDEYSATTTRHVKEFLRQETGKAVGVADMRKLIPKG